jgi:hypothetical protein
VIVQGISGIEHFLTLAALGLSTFDYSPMFSFNVVQKVGDLVKAVFAVLAIHHLVVFSMGMKVIDVIASILMGI